MHTKSTKKGNNYKKAKVPGSSGVKTTVRTEKHNVKTSRSAKSKKAKIYNSQAYPSKIGRCILFFTGLLLMPCSVALLRTLLRLKIFFPDTAFFSISSGAFYFITGFLLFCILYVTVRIPMKPYVFGHELTHVIFGLLKGAKISNFKVNENGGSVRVSRTGLVVLLAPYFFPIYMVASLIIFGLLSIFFNLVGTFIGSFFALVAGVAWGFHFCYTINSFLQPQSDLETYGFFFSVSLIIFLNLIVICLTCAALTSIQLGKMLDLSFYIFKDTLLWFWDALCEKFCSS